MWLAGGWCLAFVVGLAGLSGCVYLCCAGVCGLMCFCLFSVECCVVSVVCVCWCSRLVVVG